MEKAAEKEISGSGRIFLRCFGFQLEAEGAGFVRVRRTAGQSPNHASIDDQSNIVEGEIVEDVDPAELERLEKL